MTDYSLLSGPSRSEHAASVVFWRPRANYRAKMSARDVLEGEDSLFKCNTTGSVSATLSIQ